jgi:hypothetical protein
VAFGRGALSVAAAGVVAVSRVIPLQLSNAGLEQLGGGRLIGLEQFIRPRQTLKPCAQRLDLLIMRLDCLARPLAISSCSRFL